MNVKENVFFLQSASLKGHCVTRWCEQRDMNSYQQRQIVVKFNIPLFYRYFYNHLSIYTKTIILFASGSWILVNIPLDFVSGNIHQYSLCLWRIIVKYSAPFILNLSQFFVSISVVFSSSSLDNLRLAVVFFPFLLPTLEFISCPFFCFCRTPCTVV